MCNEAVMLSIRDYVLKGGDVEESKIKEQKVGFKYFEKAMENVEPMSEGDLRRYKKLSPNSMYG